ncbi:amphi-Trp domain-containing protein [Streptomyces europaeiscabiei]|uniref:amphi-Trp domain-containing protein n=1 Tax=Streptomyces europaeiscabiei TaxID=146819 RepID=UPI0030DFFCA6
MRDLKFEQKRSLSRLEAADQLTALAAALREGGEADVELGHGTLSLRIPDDLRSEVEVEIGDGEIELEIEFKWPTAPTRTAPTRTAPTRTAPSRTAAGTGKATRRKSAAAKPARSSTGTSRSKSTKPSATKTPGAVPETSGRPTIAP